MNKNIVKYIVDVGLLFAFLGVTVTGIVKFRSFLSLIGITPNYDAMDMGLYRVIHDWSGLAMAVLVLFHLIVNWSWIVGVTKEIFSKKSDE